MLVVIQHGGEREGDQERGRRWTGVCPNFKASVFQAISLRNLSV